MKVYITKYALTEGIKEFDGKQVSDKIGYPELSVD